MTEHDDIDKSEDTVSEPVSEAPDQPAELASAGNPAESSAERPRRLKVRPEVDLPTGYRQSRRGSRALKQARKQVREQRMLRVWDKTRKTSANLLWLAGMLLATVAALGVLVWGGAWLINSAVRWNARRVASQGVGAQDQRAKENLLVIATENGKPAGFLAMRYDAKNNQVFGVAIPDGAFIEVPGQGFERLGDSLAAGPDVSAAAVTNYLSVPFQRYVVVPAAAYREALKAQSVAGLLGQVERTNVSVEELQVLGKDLAGAPSKNVALVPLPVKPIKLGTQTYFEPQRTEIADLLKTWWGVDITSADGTPRVIIYNGAGEPGIAGTAAQELIRAGYRVVDTANADKFDYATTRIIVQKGTKEDGDKVREILGTGQVSVQLADQDVANMIIVVGKDFRPNTGK